MDTGTEKHYNHKHNTATGQFIDELICSQSSQTGAVFSVLGSNDVSSGQVDNTVCTLSIIDRVSVSIRLGHEFSVVFL